ncbi:hypothetical protein BVX98_04925 [bacterium F11]|nr:hypothetical protein BVX98_04925 [bacterium F11]
MVVSCRRPGAQIEQDKIRYGLLSVERQPGSSCYPGDSASIKRRPFHPRYPTGGWGPHAEMDLNRHHDTAINKFGRIGGELTGYVQFSKPGRLAMRAYDDVYGSVYCDWSSSSVEYEPQPKPVYVRFSQCHVGDGGLDEVHELCWFPEGEEKGVILYSSAHPEQNELKPHDLFLPSHMGNLRQDGEKKTYYFNNHEADKIFDSLLVAGKLDQTRKLVSKSLENLPFLPPVIDGSTQKPIPPKEFYCETFVKLHLLKAGVNLFDPTSYNTLLEAKEILRKGKKYGFHSRYAHDLIDLYVWTVKRLQGGKEALPPIPESANKVHGYDPRFFSKILSDPTMTDKTLKKSQLTMGGESNYFWMGLREYLSGKKGEASRYLSMYKNQTNRGLNDFELAATACLLEKKNLSKKNKTKAAECASLIKEHQSFLQRIANWDLVKKEQAMEKRLVEVEDPVSCVTHDLYDALQAQMGQLIRLSSRGKTIKPTHISFCQDYEGILCRGIYADDTSHLEEFVDEVAHVDTNRDMQLMMDDRIDPIFKKVYLMRKNQRHQYTEPKKVKLSSKNIFNLNIKNTDPFLLVLLTKGKGDKLNKKVVWLLKKEKSPTK